MKKQFCAVSTIINDSVKTLLKISQTCGDTDSL